jgi:hypothetical protein
LEEQCLLLQHHLRVDSPPDPVQNPIHKCHLGTATQSLTSNTTTNSNAPGIGQTAQPTKKLTLKEKWKKLKEEDKKRKEESVKVISEEEATKITGYGKDGGPKTRDEEQNGYKSTGVGKLILGIIKL